MSRFDGESKSRPTATNANRWKLELVVGGAVFNRDSRKQNMAKTILKKKVKRKTSSAKRVAPKPAAPGFDASSLPGPDDILRVELPNGMVVLARENFTSPAVVLNGSLRAGSLDESRQRAGLARFTAAALMRGTESRTFGEIYEQIESLGARLGMGGGTHTSSFGGKALAEDLDTLLGLAADALRRPTFPAEHVEKLRGQLLTGLAIRAHDTGAMAALAFDEMLYPDHPYGTTEDGYPETVSAITRDDLVNFHHTYFSPQQMILVIVGAVKAADAVALDGGLCLRPTDVGAHRGGRAAASVGAKGSPCPQGVTDAQSGA